MHSGLGNGRPPQPDIASWVADGSRCSRGWYPGAHGKSERRWIVSIPQVLEGTWEEIQIHGAQLSGRRVKVIILDELVEESTEAPKTPEAEAVTMLDQLLAGRIGKFSFSPPDLSMRTEEAFE